MRLRTPALTLALVLAAAPLAATAQDNPTPLQRSIQAFTRALDAHPGNATLHYFLALYHARAQDKAASLAHLDKVLALGEGFLPHDGGGFEFLRKDADFLAMRAKLADKEKRVDGAAVAFRLDDKGFIPEGIARDPASGDFYVGSIARKSIARVGKDGKAHAFSAPEDGLENVLGLAVDWPRRLLYAVSTNGFVKAGRERPVNAVLRYDLATGRRTGEFRVPGALQLNDVAVAPNGEVYASDSRAGTVYRAFADGAADKPLVPPGRMRGTNGLAVSGDGRQLYLAHSMGIARFDLASGELHDVPQPPQHNTGTIDGLYWHDGALLGVQNGTNPGRVIRMALDADGRAIQRIDVLLTHHHPDVDEPTTGVVAPDGFHVLATTQVRRYNDDGKIDDPATLKAPTVLRIPLPR